MSRPCRTTTWTTILRNGLDYQKYVVEINLYTKCCAESRCEIFVNGRELPDYHLKFNGCSPLCCMDRGGSYEWQQDSHRFLIMLDKISIDACAGKFRLFVNGIDVDSGREFSSFWRRRALILFIFGLILVILITMLYVLVYVVFKLDINAGSLNGLTWIGSLGIFYIVAAIILIVRYSSARASPSAVQDYKYDQTRIV